MPRLAPRRALLLLIAGCHAEPPDAAPLAACTSAPARFEALDRARATTDPGLVGPGSGELLPLTRAALACSEASEVALSTSPGAGPTTLHLARDGWRIDQVWRHDQKAEDIVFSPPGAPARAPTALALDTIALHGLLLSYALHHEEAGALSTSSDEPWVALEGPFTAPDARDEAVVAVWAGTAHHDAWQVWLLGRDATPAGWQALAQLTVHCSGGVDAVDLDGDGRLELLIDGSCTHQGWIDGEVRVVRVERTGLRPLLQARYSGDDGGRLDVALAPGAGGARDLLLRRVRRGVPAFARYRLDPGGDRLRRVP